MHRQRYKKWLISIGLFILSLFPVFLLLAFFFSLHVTIFASILAALALFLSLLLGDKILISLLGAQKIPLHNPLVDITRNFSYQLQMRRVTVYRLSEYSSNLYFLDSYLEQPSLLIGEDLFTLLSEEELRILVFLAMLYIKEGNARFRQTCTFLTSIYYWPLFFKKRKWEFVPLQILRNIFDFYFFPLAILKTFLLKNHNEILSFDNKAVSILGHQKELASALFKLSEQEWAGERGFVRNILKDIAVAENKKNDILFNFIKLGYFAPERYQALNATKNFS